jgi:hypothetical protein
MTPGPNLEHLKMIQAIIARLAGNSFLIKGWTVTLVAGLNVLAKTDSDRSFALIAVAIIGVFALLDAYYLALERRYVALYRTEAARTTETSWTLDAGSATAADMRAALIRPAVWPLYAAALAGSLAVAWL